jgi:ADP-heptose:LPS heptosyltransferase
LKVRSLPPLLFSVRLPTLLARLWRTHLSPRTTYRPIRRDRLSFIIFRLDGLGDVVMTTPLFRELKRAYPDSHCTAVVHRALRPLLVTNPYIDQIVTLPEVNPSWLPESARTLLAALLLCWRLLRREHYDVAISPRWEVDEHLATMLCVLSSASERVGYSEKVSPLKQRLNQGFDAAFSLCLSAGPVQHEVLRNLAIVEVLGGKVEDTRLEVRLTERDREFAAKLLADVPASARMIALGIGAKSASRQWPLERYAETISALAGQHLLYPVLICSSAERQQATRLAQLLDSESIILCGAPLREVCAVLESCHLFLGNDSGSAHLAAAMDCKTIVISRHPENGDPNHPNSPLRFAPYCREHRVLQPASGLDTCTDGCSSREPHCITAVSVEDVVAAVQEMLGVTGVGDRGEHSPSPASLKVVPVAKHRPPARPVRVSRAKPNENRPEVTPTR